MRLSFDSIDEVKAFVAELKGTRGGSGKAKGESDAGQDVNAGATANVQGGAFNGGNTGFNAPQVQGAGQAGGGFPAAGAAPATHPIAKAIIERAEAAVASGQSAENVLTWFRQQIGPDAANANWQHIKENIIPRLPEASLRQIAPQLGLQV